MTYLDDRTCGTNGPDPIYELPSYNESYLVSTTRCFCMLLFAGGIEVFLPLYILYIFYLIVGWNDIYGYFLSKYLCPELFHPFWSCSLPTWSCWMGHCWILDEFRRVLQGCLAHGSVVRTILLHYLVSVYGIFKNLVNYGAYLVLFHFFTTMSKAVLTFFLCMRLN